MSEDKELIVAYFPSAEQAAGAGGKIFSRLNISDTNAMRIEQTGGAGPMVDDRVSSILYDEDTVTDLSAMAGPEHPGSGNHTLMISVPKTQADQALDIIRSAGGIA